MKTRHLLLMLVFLPCLHAAAQQPGPAVKGLRLSPKLDLVILQPEREHYRLFSAFRGFQSAFFFMAVDGTPYACVATDGSDGRTGAADAAGRRDSIVRFSRELLYRTAQKIEQWERVSAGAAEFDPSLEPQPQTVELPGELLARIRAAVGPAQFEGFLVRSAGRGATDSAHASQPAAARQAEARADTAPTPAAQARSLEDVAAQARARDSARAAASAAFLRARDSARAAAAEALKRDRLPFAGSTTVRPLLPVVHFAAGIGCRWNTLADITNIRGFYTRLEDQILANGGTPPTTVPVQSTFGMVAYTLQWMPFEFLTFQLETGSGPVMQSAVDDHLHGFELSVRGNLHPRFWDPLTVFGGIGYGRWVFETYREYNAVIREYSDGSYDELEEVIGSISTNGFLVTAGLTLDLFAFRLEPFAQLYISNTQSIHDPVRLSATLTQFSSGVRLLVAI